MKKYLLVTNVHQLNLDILVIRRLFILEGKKNKTAVIYTFSKEKKKKMHLYFNCYNFFHQLDKLHFSDPILHSVNMFTFKRKLAISFSHITMQHSIQQFAG